MSSAQFKPGDVLSYTPRRHHCKEGTAFVRDDESVLDTYWNIYGDYEYGRLNDEEIATAEVHAVTGGDAECVCGKSLVSPEGIASESRSDEGRAKGSTWHPDAPSGDAEAQTWADEDDEPKWLSVDHRGGGKMSRRPPSSGDQAS